MKNQKPIKINPAHKGLLTREIGNKGLANLPKEIKKAKAAGDTALEKREVFAKNARQWRHPDAK